jgi:hypothetical protein
MFSARPSKRSRCSVRRLQPPLPQSWRRRSFQKRAMSLRSAFALTNEHSAFAHYVFQSPRMLFPVRFGNAALDSLFAVSGVPAATNWTQATRAQTQRLESIRDTLTTLRPTNRARTWDPIIKSQQVQGGRLALDSGFLNTAPVSHQKRRYRNTTDATERVRKHSKINEGDRYSAAHNGLVAGSSPAGPTNVFRSFRRLRSLRFRSQRTARKE